MAAKWIIFFFRLGLFLIDSEMAGPIGLKLGEMIDVICEINHVKDLFSFF